MGVVQREWQVEKIVMHVITLRHELIAFYLRCGFRREAFLPDFYAPGDGKLIFVKNLGD